MRKIIKNAIPSSMARTLAAGFLIAESQNELMEDDTQCPGTTMASKTSFFEALNLSLLPMMMEQTGKDLIPTYTFGRVYRKGDELEKHTDRPACEVSCTLTLGYKSDHIWPIYAGSDEPIELDEGDLLIYAGCDVEHWRKPFEGDVWVQVFLHYVDANGPHKDHALDGRDCGPLYETIYKEIL